jgi:hypothetical protein
MIVDFNGTESYQRFVLQMQAGPVKGWDATFGRRYAETYCPIRLG